jgi:amino acid transporter
VILATVELSALLAFVGVALATAKDPASTPHSDTDWLMAILAATFLYWGWDSAFSLNEESRAPRQSPAIAALGANLALATVYVLVASAAIANAGTDALTVAGDDVFAALAGDLPGGSYTASVLSAIVLVSALASIQTTIIPSARIIFSMARSGLLPSRLAVAHPHHLSMLVYVGLLSVSEELLSTAVEATAVLIAVYYASTCFAALMLFHRALPRRRVIQRCVIPILAGTFFLAVALTALARLDVSAFVAVVILSLGAVLAAVLPRPVTAPNRRVSAAITTGRW